MRPMPRLRTRAPFLVAVLLAGCSSATKESAPVEPAGPAALAPFAGELGMGVSYLETRAADLVDAAEALLAAIEGQNLALAQRAYYDARAPYEEIEVLARCFPELHRDIDGRAYEFRAGELDPEFRGFHRIEVFLFARQRTTPALPYAARLLEDVEELQHVLTDRGRFDAATSFDAMIDRCAELATRTISGEEETWSDQSLLVIKHAWTGIHSQYRPFGPQVRERNAQLAERIDRTYRQAMELIAADFPKGQTAGGPFSLVDRTERREIADASMKLRMFLEAAAKTLELEHDAD